MSRISISKQCRTGGRTLVAACCIMTAALLPSPQQLPQQVAQGSSPLLLSAKGLAYAVKPSGGDTRQELHSPLGGPQQGTCRTAFEMKLQ